MRGGGRGKDKESESKRQRPFSLPLPPSLLLLLRFTHIFVGIISAKTLQFGTQNADEHISKHWPQRIEVPQSHSYVPHPST